MQHTGGVMHCINPANRFIDSGAINANVCVLLLLLITVCHCVGPFVQPTTEVPPDSLTKGDTRPSGEAGPNFSGDLYGGYSPATLVVCPLVAVIQWGQEIARFTAPGTLKVWCCAPAPAPSHLTI